MTLTRLATLAILVFAGTTVFDAQVWAQTTSEELADPQLFQNILPLIVTDVADKMQNLMNGGRIWQHSGVVMAFGDVVLLLHTARQWQRGKADWEDMANAVFLVFLIAALWGSFYYVGKVLFFYFDELGLWIQEALIGSTSPFAPAEYLQKLYHSFYIDDEFDLFKLDPMAFFNAMLFAGMSNLMISIGWLISVWSVIGFLVIMPIGQILLPTMLHHKISSFFEGWLKIFIGFCLYGAIGKIVISVITLIFAEMLGLQWGTAPSRTILLDPAVFGQVTTVSFLGLLMFIFGIPWIVSSIINGAFDGMGGGVKNIAIMAKTAG